MVGNEALEWPYPIKYDTVNHIYTDVVVVGGGFAGCCAGMSAARRGMRVAVCDKAPIKRSGCGGAGMDHWNGVFSSPGSPMTPEEVCEQALGWHGQMHKEYIAVKGCWDALLELERLGLPIRDEDGDFKGKPTLDEDTQLLKAYDYENMVSIKLRGGYYIKPTVYDGLRKEPNATLFERVMITNILTEGGKQGARVVGATGFSLETGEFYVFHCKAVILSSGYVCSCWIMSTEITGNSYRWDPNEIGEGMAMAWKAGAEVFGMEKNGGTEGNHPFAWPRFGVGTHSTTWFPCTLVDNNGKEIPWQDNRGHMFKPGDVASRNIPTEGHPFIGGGGLSWKKLKNGTTANPTLISDLAERIRNGEYELPLWADLAGLTDEERRSLWGLMIGNEGKTRFTIYDYYTRWGFDPEKDMLMCPIMLPENYSKSFAWFSGEPGAAKAWRSEYRFEGEIASDWDMMTRVPGLYCAGAAAGLEGCSFACSTGFYAGNRAAEYCKTVPEGELDQKQLDAEYERVYAPLKRADNPKAYVSWKELWAGSCRVMQSDCADYLTIPILEHGLKWLDSIKEHEMQLTYARNPHELARVMECETRITCSEIFIKACIAKIKANEAGVEKNKYLFNHLEGDQVVTTIRDDQYWLQEPNKPTYLENYKSHTALERETM